MHFVAKTLCERTKTRTAPADVDVLAGVLEWKRCRRRPLQQEGVAEAIWGLAIQDWIQVRPTGELPLDKGIFTGA